MINSFECLGIQNPFGHEAKHAIGGNIKQFDAVGNSYAFKIPKKPDDYVYA